MKNKKKVIIISAIAVVLLVAIYFVYKYFADEDVNKISRKVTIASHESVFLKNIEKNYHKSYDQIPEPEKYEILKKTLIDPNPIIRLTSLRYLSKLGDKEKALEILKPSLTDVSPEVVEEAIFSLKKYPKEKVEKILKDFIQECYKYPELNVPFSEIMRISLTGSSEKNVLNLQFEENQQNQMDLNEGTVYEINLLIPKDYDYIFSFPNFDNNWESFADSKIIKKIIKLDAFDDVKKLDALSDYFNIKKIVDDKIGFLSKYFNPAKLFRDDFKIAKYGSDVLFVTFKGRNIEVLTNLVNLFKTTGGFKFDVFEENYNGIKITTIKSKSGQNVLSYADIMEYFIFSNSVATLHKSIDCFQSDNTKSATFDLNFRQAYSKIDLTGKENFVFVYFNPAKISGFKGQSNYYSYFIKIALNVLKDLNGGNLDLGSVLGKYYIPKDKDDNIFKFIPESIISFYCSKNSNPINIWNYIVNVRADLPQTVFEFEKLTKINFERDIIGRMSSQLFLSYSGVNYMKNQDDRYTSLNLAIGLKLNKTQDMTTHLKNLFSFIFKKEVVKKIYSGYEVYSNGQEGLNAENNQSIVNSIAPGFCLVDNYLLVAMNPKLLQDMIDTYKGKNKSILESFAKNEISDKLYFNINSFLTDYFKYIAKYADKAQTFNTFHVENKIKPLFEVLKDLKKIEYSSDGNDYFFKGKATILME